MPGGAPLGNDNATKAKPWRAALDRALAQDDGKRLRKAAEMLLNAAAAGEEWAIKEVGDRFDGKPKQSIDAEVTGNLTVNVLRFADGDEK